MTFIMIYVTHKNMEEADKIVSHLMEKSMIACANYLPIKSSYFWKGEIKKEDEVVSILKTRTENWDVVRSEIEKIHPYETPAIIRFDVCANKEYEDWIRFI